MTMQECPTPEAPAAVVAPAKGGRMLDEKKLLRSYSCISIQNGKPVEVARILSWATPARTYASVWLKVPEDWRAGHAHAGGYGYHRESSAVQRALEAAGVRLGEDIGGMGGSTYPRAIRAALEACGMQGPFFWHQGY